MNVAYQYFINGEGKMQDVFPRKEPSPLQVKILVYLAWFILRSLFLLEFFFFKEFSRVS